MALPLSVYRGLRSRAKSYRGNPLKLKTLKDNPGFNFSAPVGKAVDKPVPKAWRAYALFFKKPGRYEPAQRAEALSGLGKPVQNGGLRGVTRGILTKIVNKRGGILREKFFTPIK